MASKMISLDSVPADLLASIFNKMPSEAFNSAPRLNRRCRQAFERNLNGFSQLPIYYLDRLRQKRAVTNKVLRIEAEYVNAILKHVQGSSFPLEDLIVDYEYTENIDAETALAGLFLKMFYQMDDEDCVFASAKSYHIFPINLAVFTMKNSKDVEYLVKLRKNGLFVEKAPEDREKLLFEAWDAVRNSSAYSMPDIL